MADASLTCACSLTCRHPTAAATTCQQSFARSRRRDLTRSVYLFICNPAFSLREYRAACTYDPLLTVCVLPGLFCLQPPCAQISAFLLSLSSWLHTQGKSFYVCALPAGPPPEGRCDFFAWASFGLHDKQRHPL